MFRKAGAIILTGLILLTAGCSRDKTEIRVYSDLPEAVELVNLFNQTQSLYKATFIYASAKGEAVNPGENDVILSRALQSYKDRMISLDSFRNLDFVKAVYPEILRTGIMDTSLRTIPLSLDFPVIIADSIRGESKFFSWEEIAPASAGFNRSADGLLTHCVFSPLWSDSFLTAYFLSGVSSFQDDMDNQNLEDLRNNLNSLISWISDANGSLELDLKFNEKYRYIPDYRLIKNGRIAYSVLPLSQWAMLPDSISRGLSARPLTIGGGIQSISILSAGIPLTSENQEGAKAFLSWLLTDKTWDDYLRLTGRNRDDSFAFMGGISSSETVNRTILVSYFPALGSFIPLKGEFSRHPEILPQWTLLWQDLLLPGIRESIRNPQTARDIVNQYRKWVLLHPDPWNS